MNIMSWNPDILIARRDGMQSSVADVIAVAKRSHGMRIRVERSKSRSISSSPGCVPASKAQFREGCVKAVELGMQLLPQKARILAEIHRRLDRASEADDGPRSWQYCAISILNFAGAWALAARLMRAGLSVSVREEDGRPQSLGSMENGRADVELVVPIGPA